ncbi:hypothetical protein ABZT17_08390 [Streptomyces sp. NPDC005648]|uniref:hypothetical protein n=1 Tax=Streptomyces sp. NPDC005648 TaxID=3157044 RepID=UPI0033B60EA1
MSHDTLLCRIRQIGKLTGRDLQSHSDRMVVGLAVLWAQVSARPATSKFMRTKRLPAASKGADPTGTFTSESDQR